MRRRKDKGRDKERLVHLVKLVLIYCLTYLFFFGLIFKACDLNSSSSSFQWHSNLFEPWKNDSSVTQRHLRHPHHLGDGDGHGDHVYTTTDDVKSVTKTPASFEDVKSGPPIEVPTIIVGALTVSFKSHDYIDTTQKNQCLPIVECQGIAKIVSYPNPEEDLAFIQPPIGTLLHQVLEGTKPLIPHLIEHDALYVPSNGYEHEMKLDSVLMQRREGAGTYYIELLRKLGRTTKLKASQSSRYPNTIGITTVFYDGLPNEVISPMTDNLRSVYNIISGSFDNNGGLSNFLRTKSIYDAEVWESRSGGLSIYTAIDLHMTTQRFATDQYFGSIEGFQRGSEKAWHLNQMESSQQLLWSESAVGPLVERGIEHEHLRSNLHTEFVIKSDRRVASDTQRFKSILEGITGRKLSFLTFIPLTHLASWEPDLDFFSLSNLNKLLSSAAKLVVGDAFDSTTVFGSLTNDQLGRIVDKFGDDLGCELSIAPEWSSFRDVANTAFDVCRTDDVFVSSKESIYDTLATKLNSRADGFWDDPFQPRTDRSLGAYNARDSYSPRDRQQAREVNLSSIQSLKAKTDSCTDAGNVHYILMVSRPILRWHIVYCFSHT